MPSTRALISTLLLTFAFTATTHAVDSYGPVKSGDSLWLISRDHRPAAAVTINQMMIAIFRRNSDAFGGNINWLYVNGTLTLPDAAEAAAIPTAEADAEVIRQNEAWRNAVDKFVAADVNRRRQLNTIISGQPSDDPEVQALRDELHALVTGLKEENRKLREELVSTKADQPSSSMYPKGPLCDGHGTWCFGASLWFGTVNDFLVVDDWNNRGRDAWHVATKSNPIIGFHAVRLLNDLWPETHWTLRTGVEYTKFEATGRFTDNDGASPSHFSTYQADYLRIPLIAQRDIDLKTTNILGEHASTFIGAGLVLNLAASHRLVATDLATNDRRDLSELMDGPLIVPSVALDAGISWRINNRHRINLELSYEKALVDGFDGLQQEGGIGSLVTSFQPGKWQLTGIRARYQF